MNFDENNPLFTLTIGQFRELISKTFEENIRGKQSLLLSQLRQSVSQTKSTEDSSSTHISERLTLLEMLIREQLSVMKDILNIDEAAAYAGLSKGHLYKLTSARKIPHYKQGKFTYFKREELAKWLTETRIKTDKEIKTEAINKLQKMKQRKKHY